ncbi:DUF1428 domain-containing protein [Bdellovibrio reynosensis]|uniref:DUF1428 domain-containing protein n=1 Tax=Bdellovibrio reynosensis TaxID=2835041 RepID=A0ABY4C6V6_9BACT|nr:DUF1428 domain-containing protein [Bdellovibrio reynosensis]UOF00650.1 DUF1428 domain-containing protein [Bdellovibrio reynosensis]
MAYVDGFVLVVPKKNINIYKKMAKLAGKVWMEHGALEYRETVSDNLKTEGDVLPFPKMTKAKPSDYVCFSWVVYKSKAHRNAVVKKVMTDPRLHAYTEMPFDMKKMSYGGFKTIVDLS